MSSTQETNNGFTTAYISRISVFFQAVVFILSSIWLYKTLDIEPGVVMVGSLGSIITSLLIRQRRSKMSGSSKTEIINVESKKGIRFRETTKATRKTKVKNLKSGGKISIKINQEG